MTTYLKLNTQCITPLSMRDTIQLLSTWESGALMAKVDLKSAFRMVPVWHQDWELLGIHWRDHYYVDTCLPFGCRSGPFLFNQFVTAIHWIPAENYQANLNHYLDDFFFSLAHQTPLNVHSQYRTCYSCVPVAMDKLEGPSTVITYVCTLVLSSTPSGEIKSATS